MPATLLGLVSDTHGYFDERLLRAFDSVDAILHAGDVGSQTVLEGLQKIAPLYAVHGNNDAPFDNLGLPLHVDVSFGGVQLHLVHELPHARPPEGTRVIVFGHSHRQLNEWRDDFLYVNPGAAGRRGFHKLQTAALLRIEAGEPSVEPLILGERLTPPRRQSRLTRPSDDPLTLEAARESRHAPQHPSQAPPLCSDGEGCRPQSTG